MGNTIGFRPTEEDERILASAAGPGDTRTDVLRRALRLLDHEVWLQQFQRDAEALAGENLNDEAEAW